MSSSFFIPKYLTVSGGKPVRGTVSISGAKNSILGLMAAALLTDEPVMLTNVPWISDVLEMGHLMREFGVDVKYNTERREMRIHAKNVTSNILGEKALLFRASYYLWGALLARFSWTREFNSLVVFIPGGCSFGGKRKTDFHETLLKSIFSVDIRCESNAEHDLLIFTLPDIIPVPLVRELIYATSKVSHGATFHWLLSVMGAREIKLMYNASLEPEVENLTRMLQSMGLSLDGNERTGLVYDGRNRGLLRGGTFSVMPDRLEAGSYALLALATRGEVCLKDIDIVSLEPWLSLLKKLTGPDALIIYDDKNMFLDFRNVQNISGGIIHMSPFPGYETDLQQIWTPVLATAREDSRIIDVIWPGRSAHLAKMTEFGLQSEVNMIDGAEDVPSVRDGILDVVIHPSFFKPANVNGMDLRGTMGIIMCAAMANGESRITDPSYALRGYPNLVKNLQTLGVDITVSDAGVIIPPLPKLV